MYLKIAKVVVSNLLRGLKCLCQNHPDNLKLCDTYRSVGNCASAVLNLKDQNILRLGAPKKLCLVVLTGNEEDLKCMQSCKHTGEQLSTGWHCEM